MRGLLVVSVVALVTGCGLFGGGSPEAKAPSATVGVESGDKVDAKSGVVSGQDGAQFAIADGDQAGGQERPLHPSAAESYAAGLQAFRTGDMATAAKSFEKAATEDPEAYQVHYSLGTVKERFGDGAGALASYQKALKLKPTYIPAIVSTALLLAGRGELDDAESFLKEKQAALGQSVEVLTALAEVKSLQGRSGEAQQLAQQALKLKPSYRPAMVVLARDHYRNRRLDLALYALRGILDGYGPENPPRDKDNAEARLLRAIIYREQGQRIPAIEELETVLKLRPDLVQARVQLATYLLESGNAPRAAELLEGAARYDAANVRVRLNLGDAYRLLGKVEDAERQLKWVLEKEPSTVEAHYNLGLLYLFSPKVGALSRKELAEKSIASFEAYQKGRTRGTGPDDVDELLTRARSKKAIIESEEEEARMAEEAKKNPKPPEGEAPADGEAPAEDAPPADDAAPADGAAAPGKGDK